MHMGAATVEISGRLNMQTRILVRSTPEAVVILRDLPLRCVRKIPFQIRPAFVLVCCGDVNGGYLDQTL